MRALPAGRASAFPLIVAIFLHSTFNLATGITCGEDVPPPVKRIDQKSVDEALDRLKQRQQERARAATRPGATSRPSQVSSLALPPRPDDINEETWNELGRYLIEERRCVAEKIGAYQRQHGSKEIIQSLKDGTAPPSMLDGPVIDLEHVRLNQIGRVGTGGRNQIAVVLLSDMSDANGESKILVGWQRWEDRSYKMDRVISNRYRLYINGNPTNVMATTHDIDSGAITVETTAMVNSREVLLHETGVPMQLYENKPIRRGQSFYSDQVYQVTNVGGRWVEVRPVDITKLKRRFAEQAGLPPTNQGGRTEPPTTSVAPGAAQDEEEAERKARLELYKDRNREPVWRAKP